jgi:hypothetical protein
MHFGFPYVGAHHFVSGCKFHSCTSTWSIYFRYLIFWNHLMSALASISLFMHRLRFAKKRACAGLLVVSWLLLNTQIALASHNCNLQFSGEPPMAQHMMHMQNSQPSSEQMQTQEPLCEKHCVPESAQQDHANLALAALPVSSELAVIAPALSLSIPFNTWQTPPITGPPAEIVFCRFRE